MVKEILEVNQLDLSFKQYKSMFQQKENFILKNINLKVYEGEILVIFGASGSGKSLLAHACLDLLPNNAIVTGEIKYFGQLQTSASLQKLRGREISFVPQTLSSLNPLLKIKNQIDKDIQRNSDQLTLLKKDFHRFGLPPSVLDMYPGQLSGGMARKILVAMSLTNHPRFIIADEPTPGMDNIGLNYIVDLVKAEKSKGTGAMIISHDIRTTLKIADRIAIFYEGQIIEIARPSQFQGKGQLLKHPYSRALWQALPENDFKVSDEFENEWLEEVQ